MSIFDILPLYIDDITLYYWPGDQYTEIEQRHEYESCIKNRMDRMRAYLTSFDYIRDSVVAMVSAIPRWRFVRALDSLDTANPGLVKGLSSICHTKYSTLNQAAIDPLNSP